MLAISLRRVRLLNLARDDRPSDIWSLRDRSSGASTFGVALNGPSGVWVRLQDNRHSYQIGQAASLQLLDNVRTMQFDRPKADAEMTRDDLVRLACSHELEDLSLAFGQKRGTCLQLGAFQPLHARRV